MYVIICRGLSGAGKSTRAKELQALYTALGISTVICSADDYFMKDGVYVFDRNLLGKAHAACQDKFRKAVDNGINAVIVDNTNLTAKECRPYVIYGREKNYNVSLETIPVTLDQLDELEKRNQHGVTKEILLRMYDRFDQNLTVEKILQNKS